MNFNETIPYLIVQISTFYKVEIEKELNEFDLHAGQIFILFELWKDDGLSQIELSTRLQLSPPTVNKMVKSLAKNGFVANASCPKDGRLLRVFLTPKGAAIRPRVEEKWQKIEEKIVANLTPTEHLVLAQLFDRLIDNLIIRKTSTS